MYNNYSPRPQQEEFPIGMAYVPWQVFKGIYDNLEEAFEIGTVFPCLNLPFTGRRCCDD